MSPRRRAALALCRWLLVGWLGVVLVALHLPAPSAVPEAQQDSVRAVWQGAARAGEFVPESVVAVLSVLVGDKTLHLLLFLPLALLWTGARRLARQPRVGGVVVPGLLGLALLSEGAQVLGGRIADPGDLLANAAGVALGFGLGAGIGRRRRREI